MKRFIFERKDYRTGQLIFKSDDGKELKKTIYHTPKNKQYLMNYGHYYIIHNKEKIYFSNCFNRVLIKY